MGDHRVGQINDERGQINYGPTRQLEDLNQGATCTTTQLLCTVNRVYFVIKYFWTAWLVRKLNARKYIHNINDNAVQGRLSKNYLMRNFIA